MEWSFLVTRMGFSVWECSSFFGRVVLFCFQSGLFLIGLVVFSCLDDGFVLLAGMVLFCLREWLSTGFLGEYCVSGCLELFLCGLLIAWSIYSAMRADSHLKIAN